MTFAKSKGGFQVPDVKETFSLIEGFDFDSWSKFGTGSAAEKQAGDDLIAELQSAGETDSAEGASIRL